jgi:hypothetical protein
MFSKYVKLTAVLILIGFTSANAQYEMARIDQSGDIIDGPVVLDGSTPSGVCKVSDTGYIYYIASYNSYKYVYDSSLNFVNSVYVSGQNLSVDNMRQEISVGHTVTRFDQTLNQTDYFEVPGDLEWLTVDETDGAVWYTSHDPPEGLNKIAYDGTMIYSSISDYNGIFSDVSPSGSFWLNKIGSWNPRLFDSDGTSRAEANIDSREVLEMHFASEALWMITDSDTVAKANSSGAIVYNNSADFNQPHDLDVDQSDGSVWVADTNNFEVVHLDSSGSELLRKTNDWTPYVVAVDPSDSTVIVLYQPGEVGIKSASLGEIKAMYAEPEE